MITVLHRGGYAQMITILHGGGSLRTPKSDYVICARPLIELNVFLKRFCKLGSGFLSTGQCPPKDTEDTPICSQKIVAATVILSWAFFICINMYLLKT